LPARLLGSVLVIELLVVSLLVVDAVRGGRAEFTRHHTVILGVLAVVGVLHTEIALRVERARRRVTPSPHIDLSSVWTFAAALLLPPLLASVGVAVIYLHLYVRVWRPTRQPAYRWVFTTCTVVLSVHAASAAIAYVDSSDVFGSGVGLSAIVVALLCYTTVNTCLVVGVIVLSAPDRSFREVLGRGDEVILELATLAMGALAAGTISSASPLHAVLVLPPLVVLHRAVLVRHLQEVASTDGKTGLLNAAAWQDRATRVLQRAQRSQGSAAVLILDLDHFKQVNDRHGHLAGDRVLASVAAELRAEVRDNDLVGRFGGEEFVIMLPGHQEAEYDRAELEAVAERIRRRIDTLGVEIDTPDGPLTVGDLSVSVGGATFPQDAPDLDRLLAVADSALYAAKRAGRNAVRVGLHLHPAQHGPTEPPQQRIAGDVAEPSPRH
jgi:diguanylate cyclase (GGDEF)-like protein